MGAGGRGKRESPAPADRGRIAFTLRSRATAALAGLFCVVFAPEAGAHDLALHADTQDPLTAEQPAAAGAVASCGAAPGLPFSPDVAVTGSFGAVDQGSYLMVPFDVPAG